MKERNEVNKIVHLKEYKEKQEENSPHLVAELICLSCHDRWIGVWAEKTLLKDLECKCGVKGKVIQTGQIVD